MNSNPDFVCIGYPKTGTTWLSTMLSAHPNIYVHPAKEVNYFWGQITSKRWYSPLLYNSLGRSLVNYNSKWKRMAFIRWREQMHNETKPWFRRKNWRMLSYFSPVQSKFWYNLQFDSNKTSGDITPSYISRYSEREIKLLYKNNPKTKILCRLRNPVEQAWSMAKMLKAKMLRRNFEFHFKKSIEKAVSFEEKIDLWRSVFPQDKFHLSFYEDFKTNHEDHLIDILTFLEVDIPKSRLFWNPLDQKINTGLRDSIFPEELKIKAAAEVLPILPRLGKYVPERILEQWIDRTEKISKTILTDVWTA